MIKTYDRFRNFGYDLFRQLMQKKNPVISPVSVYLTLAMAGCGANGTTRTEFVDVLGEDMTALSEDLMKTFSVKGDWLNLSVANSAWIDQRFIIHPAWADTIQSLMKTEIFKADLSACETMDKMNHWIATQTNGLVPQLLTEPLEPKGLLRLALFNTVYFQGKWESPFEPFNTHKEVFYLRDGQNDNWDKQSQHRTVQVDMMRDRTANVTYLYNDFAEGVLLPYRMNQSDQNKHTGFHVFECLDTYKKRVDKGLGLIALKPKHYSSIRDVCSRLSGCAVHEMLSNRQIELADLKIPRFKAAFDVDFIESLTKVGLTECFDMNRADLSLLGKDAETDDILYVSLVRQKAVLAVDEDGTEAAAVTELLGCLRAMTDPQKQLYFNEPFLYIIMDLEKELPLFIGILDDPDR